MTEIIYGLCVVAWIAAGKFLAYSIQNYPGTIQCREGLCMRRITNSVASLLVKLAGLLSVPKLLGTGHHSLWQKPYRGFTEEREQIQHDWEQVGDDMYRALDSYRNRR